MKNIKNKRFFCKNKNAFTLIELLLVIFLIIMWIIWTSSLNFNLLTDKQKLENFVNRANIEFEEIQSNALLWKWIWATLENPDKWKIEFLSSWTWNIKIYYKIWYWILYKNIEVEKDYNIEDIICSSLDWTFTWSIWSWTWIIEIEWSSLVLTWACSDIRFKKIKTIFNLNNIHKKTFEINTVNWLSKIF